MAVSKDAKLMMTGAIVLGLVGIVFMYPSFIEGRRRDSPYMPRVRSDMRSMATALESYYIDNNQYPAWTLDPAHGALNGGEAGAPIPSFRMRDATALSTLTTPTAYLNFLFEDAYSKTKGRPFAYYAPGPGWVLFSPGPDGDFDLQWEVYDPKIAQPSPELLLYSYDVTNGTISTGDLIRVKQ